MTNKEYIQKLLDSYLVAGTTKEEEKLLSDYFCSHQDIPAEWQNFSVMFRGLRQAKTKSIAFHKRTLLKWSAVTAVAASILLLLVFRFGQEPEEEQPVVAEVIEPKMVEQNTPQPIVEEKKVELQEPSEAQKANEPNTPHKPYKSSEAHNPQPQQLVAVTTTSAADSTPRLTNAADSLYYYLTQLENQMGECRDSTCFAELGNLMRADERIKGLVNKIIHKQVETAYQEEYLVDTTTHYIPL